MAAVCGRRMSIRLVHDMAWLPPLRCRSNQVRQKATEASLFVVSHTYRDPYLSLCNRRIKECFE